MKIFISHCSEDGKVIEKLVSIWKACGTDITLFYSSNPETGVAAGDGLLNRINGEIEQCDYFVPIITENYVRSLYCIYELSVAMYLQNSQCRKVPICSSAKQYEALGNILSAADLLYIDAQSAGKTALFFESFPWMKGEKSEEMVLKIEDFLNMLADSQKSQRPYIGMSREEYGKILEYCDGHGIDAVTDMPLASSEIKAHIQGAKEITLFATTGAGLIKTIAMDALTEALLSGTNINVILPNQYSDFCGDIAVIERADDEEGVKANYKRLADEFDAVTGYLKEAVKAAKSRCGEEKIGEVTCYCSYTLLRQTIFLAEYADRHSWGWVSLTMPPMRTASRSILLQVHGDGIPGETADLLLIHCRAVMKIAVQRGGVLKIREDSDSRPFFLEKMQARAYWDKKYRQAMENMEERRDLSDMVLIEVAAQHPLKRKKVPGTEFAARLDFAAELYEKLTEEGREAVIYVPGSRHRSGKIADTVSLSAAGVQYLLGKGIPQEALLGEEMNQKYKGDDGVYNSADECYVASKIFFDGEYENLYCVCSPNQVPRKTLFYLEFGIIPHCYSVPVDNMYHSILNELFESLETVLYRDHSWQDPESETFINSRLSRRPENFSE